jgi:hypothetical protein
MEFRNGSKLTGGGAGRCGSDALVGLFLETFLEVGPMQFQNGSKSTGGGAGRCRRDAD